MRHIARVHAHQVAHDKLLAVVGLQEGAHHCRVAVVVDLGVRRLGHEGVDLGLAQRPAPVVVPEPEGAIQDQAQQPHPPRADHHAAPWFTPDHRLARVQALDSPATHAQKRRDPALHSPSTPSIASCRPAGTCRPIVSKVGVRQSAMHTSRRPGAGSAGPPVLEEHPPALTRRRALAERTDQAATRQDSDLRHTIY